jgi:hypothetical protein
MQGGSEMECGRRTCCCITEIETPWSNENFTDRESYKDLQNGVD